MHRGFLLTYLLTYCCRQTIAVNGATSLAACFSLRITRCGLICQVILLNNHLIPNEAVSLAVSPLAYTRVVAFLNRNAFHFEITSYDLQKSVNTFNNYYYYEWGNGVWTARIVFMMPLIMVVTYVGLHQSQLSVSRLTILLISWPSIHYKPTVQCV